MLSKEHYCYKIFTLLTKSSAYLFFYRFFWNIPNVEIDEGYIWVWSTTQTNRNQNESNRDSFKQWVGLSLHDCRNAQTSNPVQTKEIEMAKIGPTPCQFDKWNCQVFINIKKYKIVFKIRKYHLRIFFLSENNTIWIGFILRSCIL